jgi:hypothetical protein
MKQLMQAGMRALHIWRGLLNIINTKMIDFCKPNVAL